jgi:V8-like Glu-specific endopeptidase
MEARGLTARIYKQLYVNNNDPASPRNRSNLERALGEYLHVYRLDPRTHLWHGINVVALAARARRDGLPDAGLPDAAALAAEIVATLDKSEEEGGDIRAWDEATRMEAYLALGRQTDAVKTAQRYLNALDVDAFELQSTIRQLVEVWQLKDTEPPGSLLLPLLRAGLLRKEGAVLGLDPRKVVAQAAAANDATKGLEAIFGTDKMVTFDWYRKGLAQCSAVARVEQRNGTGHGTGWLVKAADFFPGWKGVLVLTNDHVVSETPNPHAIFPEDSQVNFQALGEKYEVERVVWSSSFREMDAAFLKLRPNANGEPKAEPLRLHERALAMADPTPRMYIIGHPAGRDLELSLQDNLLVASNDTLLHYRTPTEPGSSGSPVFEPLDWRVVALHHKGSRTMRRIDGGDGTYEANEGIAILSIRKQTQSAGLAPPPSAGG